MTQAQKSDAEKASAIDNVQAMLNLDNIDDVVQLLQENNWDEMAALEAYYVK